LDQEALESTWLVVAEPSLTQLTGCAWTTTGIISLRDCHIFLHFSYRFEIQGAYSDYISNGDGSRQTISTSVSTFRKYLLTSRVFDHQDWSAGFNCWVSRPGCAGRSRTLFKKGEYIKSDAAPLKRCGPLPTSYEC
jgi:hypothetical protein